MQKSLSVVVPNYNNAKYLSQCLDSILKQTYPISEIIVFDDASTDNSVEILREYEETNSNLHVIYANKNVGVSSARDYAIRKTSSEYVTVIDADDFYWSNDKLMKEMEIINCCSEEVCAFSQTVKVDETGVPYSSIKHRDLSHNIRWKTVTRLFGIFAPRDYCFSKQIYLELGGYIADMKLYEDWELNLRLMSRCKFVYSNTYGTAYRQKENGLSKVDAKKHLDAKKKAFNHNRQALKYTISEKVVFFVLLYFNYLRKIIRTGSV